MTAHKAGLETPLELCIDWVSGQQEAAVLSPKQRSYLYLELMIIYNLCHVQGSLLPISGLAPLVD